MRGNRQRRWTLPKVSDACLAAPDAELQMQHYIPVDSRLQCLPCICLSIFINSLGPGPGVLHSAACMWLKSHLECYQPGSGTEILRMINQWTATASCNRRLSTSGRVTIPGISLCIYNTNLARSHSALCMQGGVSVCFVQPGGVAPGNFPGQPQRPGHTPFRLNGTTFRAMFRGILTPSILLLHDEIRSQDPVADSRRAMQSP